MCIRDRKDAAHSKAAQQAEIVTKQEQAKLPARASPVKTTSARPAIENVAQNLAPSTTRAHDSGLPLEAEARAVQMYERITGNLPPKTAFNKSVVAAMHGGDFNSLLSLEESDDGISLEQWLHSWGKLLAEHDLSVFNVFLTHMEHGSMASDLSTVTEALHRSVPSENDSLDPSEEQLAFRVFECLDSAQVGSFEASSLLIAHGGDRSGLLACLDHEASQISLKEFRSLLCGIKSSKGTGTLQVFLQHMAQVHVCLNAEEYNRASLVAAQNHVLPSIASVRVVQPVPREAVVPRNNLSNQRRVAREQAAAARSEQDQGWVRASESQAITLLASHSLETAMQALGGSTLYRIVAPAGVAFLAGPSMETRAEGVPGLHTGDLVCGSLVEEHAGIEYLLCAQCELWLPLEWGGTQVLIECEPCTAFGGGVVHLACVVEPGHPYRTTPLFSSSPGARSELLTKLASRVVLAGEGGVRWYLCHLRRAWLPCRTLGEQPTIVMTEAPVNSRRCIRYLPKHPEKPLDAWNFPAQSGHIVERIQQADDGRGWHACARVLAWDGCYMVLKTAEMLWVPVADEHGKRALIAKPEKSANCFFSYKT
eukprot:TRINITY_DN33597_c0_g1_i2.p1 TRINITY_DN33597_c0_g1~~TRINITY_DN33597_c0_g1_i2.p1  ORF type:complete len:595 (-),score=90.22 TRINITY_DN33597_c0_g1_i2:130-1914(-)